MNSNVLSSKKRMMFLLYFSVVFAIILIIKVAHLQFIMAPTLMEKIALQQSSSRNITPNRGTIYDSTEKNILAMSSTVESVTVNPVNISNENKEKVARKLAELFELDNILSGINIDEDTKRYYPNSDFASHIIGFCGSDNQGLDGIEAKYDEILKGKNGKISKYIDAKGNEFGNEGEVYENPIDGNDLVLSIDFNIQSIVEKYLEEACIDNVCTDGGNVIMMNPKNGDILAMATYPYYDLNSPYEINSEELKEVWELLELGEKSKNLQAMWRNKAIADTYEPGSTFKLVTASASIEEGLATPDKKGVFNCGGGIEIAGRRIKCWRYYRPHGAQSLREGLMNSCNPVFIGLGQKMGVNKYYKYLDKFGFLKKTGIDLPGEAGSIFLKEEKVGPVELATISFGQRFEVTPIQMITMVSTIANNGRYVKPRVVKKVIDSVTGEVTEIEPEFGEQVIKSETAKDILSMMTSVVAEGTGKNARVEGYNVGGKTGTSEDGVNTGKYVTSFIGVAPTDDPQIAILVTLYNPTGEGGHQGGGVAAPVAGKILSEVINYLEIKPNNNEEL